MEIIIHRGPHQIGGCITEIKTEEARIVIDMGAPLPGSGTERKLEKMDDAFSIDGVTLPDRGTDSAENDPDMAAVQPCDAVFITHYHGDHIGLIDTLLPGIPLYMGSAAREIYGMYCDRIGAEEKVDRLCEARTFQHGRPIQIKNITVTPLLTSHSALDAYMLLIEAEGKTVLHTGDFTLHGHEEKRWLADLQSMLRDKHLNSVDYLICEGTMLPDQTRTSPTELDVAQKAAALMKKYRKVFVLCSSTHIDRIAAFYHHRSYHSPLISDYFQNTILEYVTAIYGRTDYFYRLDYAYTYSDKNRKLLDLMDEYGFIALIRANSWSRKLLEKYYDEADSAIVYSMWSGYLKEGPARNERLCRFLRPYNITAFIHAGGHALPLEIKEFVEAINPRHIIPIHTEHPKAMQELLPDRAILLPEDNEILHI